MNIDQFRLTDGERASPLWAKLKTYLDMRLQKVRERNDAPASEQETATTRGEIKALKGLLALGKELPPYDGDGSQPTETRAGMVM